MGIFDRKPNVEKLEAKKDIEGLIKVLKSEKGRLLQKTAEALGEIGDARAVEPLKKALNDGSGYVREAARDALEK